MMNIETPLIIMTFFYLFAWLPISFAKSKAYGNKYLASNRSKDVPNLEGWGGRSQRAYENLKDFFLPFAISIILIKLNSNVSSLTVYLAWAYTLLRLSHYFFYLIGNVPLRFLTWISSVIINVILLVKAVS